MRTQHRPSRAALGTLGAIAAGKLILHLFAIGQYGYFRDELYYLASTQHLSWGYVDHPPFSIAFLAVVRALLGDSLFAVRIVPALAGVAMVFLCGVIAALLGGGRFAQGLAAFAALLNPLFLGLDHFYSMNALELLFWTVAAWLLLRALASERTRDWLILGLVLGIGLLNKISTSWFGGLLTAANHTSRPSSEWPIMPTLPLAPGRRAAHSTAS